MTSADISLDPWQKEILEHDGNILLCTGRQVGKTTIFAIKAGKYLLNHPNHQIIIASLTEDQAKLIIIMILDWLEKNAPKEVAKGKDKPTQSRITLKNGAQAIARPCGNTGDAIRGFTGNVLILDEMSRMNELIFEASKPTLLTTAGQIWGCSTPKGKKGYFYECFLNKDGRFKVWHINSEQVINNRPVTAGWTQEQKDKSIAFLSQEKRDMSQLQYSQEYLGLFMEELRQYIPDTLIAKACILKRPEIRSEHDINIMGVDVARLGGDLCAYEILTARDKVFHQVENITRKEQLTTQTEQDIISLSKAWHVSKIGIDAGSGSLGVGIFDRLLENPETKFKTIPMNNRSIALERDGSKKQRLQKEDFYDNFVSMLEKGELLLLDDADVILSLKSVQYEIVEKDGFSKVRIFGLDTHICEGLVRASYLAKKAKLNKLWISYL